MSNRDSPGILLAAPFYLVAFMALGVGLGRIWPLGFLPTGIPDLSGYAVVGISLFLLWRVEKEFAACETDARCRVGDSALITTGPFRYSRNPAYVAMAIMVAGLSVTMNNLWLAIMILPACLSVYWFCIRKEETYLEATFGADYVEYRRSVRRWL